MHEYAYEHCSRDLASEKLKQGFVVDEEGMKGIQYRWEFLRRNEGYKKDYYKSLKAIKGFRQLGWYSETGFEELDFCKKWRLGVPIAPEKSFASLEKEVRKEVNALSFDIFIKDNLGRKNKKQYVRLFLYSMLKPDDYFFQPVTGWGCCECRQSSQGRHNPGPPLWHQWDGLPPPARHQA